MANLQSSTITGVLTEKIGTTPTLSGNPATLTVDMSTGKVFEVDLQNASGPIATFTITNPPASGKMGSFTLKISQGSPARQFNWGSMSGAEPDWAGGAPTLTGTDNAVDILSFSTYDQGTTWHGEVVGQNFT